MTEIAEVMGTTSAAMTSTVDRLVRDGLARRAEVPGDRRQYTLSLTDKGARYLRLAHDAVECPKVKPVKV
jgi:DNA-binding MarR family transcriptional regulator